MGQDKWDKLDGHDAHVLNYISHWMALISGMLDFCCNTFRLT
jgi:hypothetical protein